MAWYDGALRAGAAWSTGGLSEIGANAFGGGGNPLNWTTGDKIKLDPNAGYLPRGQEMYDRASNGYAVAGQRQAPLSTRTQIAPVQTMRGGGFGRDAQMQVANRLLGIGTGQQAGAGELAVQRQGTRALAQNQAMARMGRGAGAALAGRDAARAAGEIGLQTAGQAQGAALNDQMAALGQAGQVSGQLRGQDIDVQGRNMDAQNQRIFQQAGLDQARSLADVQARLAQTGMNDQMQMQFMAQMMGVSAAEMQGLLQREQLRIGNAGTPIFPALLQAGGQVGGAAAMASDRDLKKDTRRINRQLDDMLDKLVPQSYRYKDEKHGEGRRAGIMAQDLERSEAGRRIVRDLPEGKHVDVNAGLSAALAAVARLNERVRKVEGKGK